MLICYTHPHQQQHQHQMMLKYNLHSLTYMLCPSHHYSNCSLCTHNIFHSGRIVFDCDTALWTCKCVPNSIITYICSSSCDFLSFGCVLALHYSLVNHTECPWNTFFFMMPAIFHSILISLSIFLIYILRLLVVLSMMHYCTHRSDQ